MSKDTPQVKDTSKHASAIRDERALEQLLAELPQGAQYVLLQRQNDTDPTKWDHSGKILAADFSIEAVKDFHGGGAYRAQMVGEKGRLMGTKLEFSIDSRFKPTKGPLAVVPVTAPSGVVESSSLAKIEKLLEMNLMLQLKGAGAPAAPVTDPFQGALKIAELMKSNAPAASGESLVETLLRGMTLGQKMAGGDKDGLSELAHASSPLFEAIATNLLTDAEIKRNRRNMKAIPGGAKVATATNDWRDRVRPHVAKLVALAEAGKDPELYGELVLDNLPDEAFAELEGEAKRAGSSEAFVAKVLEAFPDLQPHREWMTQFLAFVYGELVAVTAEGAVGG